MKSLASDAPTRQAHADHSDKAGAQTSGSLFSNVNIALFASAFYPHVGGVEELVRQLAHSYAREGITAIVLTNRWPRSLPAYEEYEGIFVYRLALRVPDGSFKAHINFSLTHRSIRREMLGILRKHKIDLLHVQCVSSNGFYALLAKQSLKLPLVVTTQGERTMDASQIYQRSKFMNAMFRNLLFEANAITACSRNTLDDVEQYYGQPLGDRSRVIYNGIELKDFEGTPSYAFPRPYILGIGRLVPQKGFDILLRAFAKSNANSHDLLIAGEGPERQALEQLAKELGLEKRVQFLGRADRPTAVSLFKGCSFFVLPSRHEPMGIVNLEAMAAGKAVIASRVGGVPEIVRENETGLLVPGADVTTLAQAIGTVASNAPLREQLGMNGQQRAREFDWPVITRQYLDLYEAVISGGKVRHE